MNDNILNISKIRFDKEHNILELTSDTDEIFIMKNVHLVNVSKNTDESLNQNIKCKLHHDKSIPYRIWLDNIRSIWCSGEINRPKTTYKIDEYK